MNANTKRKQVEEVEALGAKYLRYSKAPYGWAETIRDDIVGDCLEVNLDNVIAALQARHWVGEVE